MIEPRPMPPTPSDFPTLAANVGEAEAAAIMADAAPLRARIEHAPGLRADERRQLLRWIVGERIEAPAGRPAAVAREALAAAEIAAEVTERPAATPDPAAERPQSARDPRPRALASGQKRPRKRRKPRNRPAAPAVAAAPKPEHPAKPATPKLTPEQRAERIAASRPREFAAAIRANAETLTALIADPDAVAAFRWMTKPPAVPRRIVPGPAGRGAVRVVVPTGDDYDEWTAGDADRAARALIDASRELGVLAAAVDLLPDRRPQRVLTVAAADVRHVEESNLPALAAEPLPVGEQLSLLPAVVGVAAEHPALWLYDRAGQPLKTKGTGAPLPLRLFFSALLSAPLQEGRTVDLPLTVRDLVADLWPNGWQRGRDMPKLRDALRRIDSARVRFRNADWRLVGVTAMPAPLAGLDDPVVLSVHIPAGAGRGPLILRRLLFALGVRSAPLMRAYLGVAAYSDRYGQRGGSSLRPTRPADWNHPDGERIVRPDADPALRRLPALTPADRRRMVYGPDDPTLTRSSIRDRQAVADAALEALAAAGAIEIRKAPDGWRILRADLDQPPGWTPDRKLLTP